MVLGLQRMNYPQGAVDQQSHMSLTDQTVPARLGKCSWLRRLVHQNTRTGNSEKRPKDIVPDVRFVPEADIAIHQN